MQTVADGLADDYTLSVGHGREKDKKLELETLGLYVRRTTNRRVANRRLHVFEGGGFVQQHDMQCKGPDGREWSLRACVVGVVRGGKLVHVDEYVDDSGPLFSSLREAGRGDPGSAKSP